MIAKLIVRGSTREMAISKLNMALEQYEIAGPVTNIEFLKRICRSSAFLVGNVETGFISKHREELLSDLDVTPEIYAQASIGTIIQEKYNIQLGSMSSDGTCLGFTSGLQNRILRFTSTKDSGNGQIDISIEVKQIDEDTFNVKVNNISFFGVRSSWDTRSRLLTSFFSHTRLETRIIFDEGKITMFQQGREYRLNHTTPKWIEKALGFKDATNSVLAPMPCKILRVEVEEDQAVSKNQALVVIESMKMETVIRSPQDGIIAKIIHQKGVC